MVVSAYLAQLTASLDSAVNSIVSLNTSLNLHVQLSMEQLEELNSSVFSWTEAYEKKLPEDLEALNRTIPRKVDFKMVEFVENGSWVVPPGVSTAFVTAISGGSAGCNGGGGNSGVFVIFYPVSVTEGTIVDITIGMGGRAGDCSIESNGTPTSFGDYLILMGGSMVTDNYFSSRASLNVLNYTSGTIVNSTCNDEANGSASPFGNGPNCGELPIPSTGTGGSGGVDPLYVASNGASGFCRVYYAQLS